MVASLSTVILSMSSGLKKESGLTELLIPGIMFVLSPVYARTPSIIQSGSLEADRDASPRIRTLYLDLVLLAASVFGSIFNPGTKPSKRLSIRCAGRFLKLELLT